MASFQAQRILSERMTFLTYVWKEVEITIEVLYVQQLNDSVKNDDVEFIDFTACL